MIPEKDRVLNQLTDGRSEAADGPDLTASAQVSGSARPGLAQAPDPSSLDGFLAHRASELAEQHGGLAERSSAIATALDNDPTSVPLARSATHLEARDAHLLAAFWHRESLGETGSKTPYHLAEAQRHAAVADFHAKAWEPAFEQANSSTREVVMDMASAFYSSSWASEMEEAGYSFPAQTRINDVAPAPTQAAIARAIMDAQNLCANSGAATLDELLQRAADADGHGDTDLVITDGFGSDMAMEMLGSGVSWKDDHQEFSYQAPNTEFLVDRDEPILRWVRPGSRMDFCGYVAHNLADAVEQHEEAGGWLLRTGADSFVVCDEDQAMKAWGRTEADLARLEKTNFSEA
jgi:hypothetical protein